jgi:hypothetical protein
MTVDYPLPRVHLNGTGRKMLMEGYSKAQDTLNAAITDMAHIEFNARDYYILDEDNAYHKARTKRDEMFAKLREVEEYLLAHMEAVS